jgi:hypothetical protein
LLVRRQDSTHHSERPRRTAVCVRPTSMPTAGCCCGKAPPQPGPHQKRRRQTNRQTKQSVPDTDHTHAHKQTGTTDTSSPLQQHHTTQYHGLSAAAMYMHMRTAPNPIQYTPGRPPLPDLVGSLHTGRTPRSTTLATRCNPATSSDRETNTTACYAVLRHALHVRPTPATQHTYRAGVHQAHSLLHQGWIGACSWQLLLGTRRCSRTVSSTLVGPAQCKCKQHPRRLLS